jgi:hypothetical protein
VTSVWPELTERIYTPQEIATIWRLSTKTVQRIFQDEIGVLKIGSTAIRRGKQKPHVTLRIPESVLARVFRERTK